MGKIVYFINAFFGILVGAIVAFMSIFAQIKEGFNAGMVGLFVGGILSVWFGIYQWKKFRNPPEKVPNQ